MCRKKCSQEMGQQSRMPAIYRPPIAAPYGPSIPQSEIDLDLQMQIDFLRV